MRVRIGPDRAGVVLCLLAAALLVLTGCGRGGGADAPAAGRTVALGSIHRSGTTSLQVISAGGQTLAVAQVSIGGNGRSRSSSTPAPRAPWSTGTSSTSCA